MITLLTDFGLLDTYVGQMKGAILSIAPSAPVVDLTHGIPPQDVLTAAFNLWSAVDAFPSGTVHVAVVDPGVGSARRPIAVEALRGDLLVGPDNGVLIPAANRLGGVTSVVELSNSRYWRQATTSATFHGRDIFGPAAAHLALGIPLAELGRVVAEPVNLAIPEPRGLEGEVIHVDTYGNLVTNFSAARLPVEFRVEISGRLVDRVSFYAAAEPKALVALVGSAGLLEIAARDASAALLIGAGRGTRVTLKAP